MSWRGKTRSRSGVVCNCAAKHLNHEVHSAECDSQRWERLRVAPVPKDAPPVFLHLANHQAMHTVKEAAAEGEWERGFGGGVMLDEQGKPLRKPKRRPRGGDKRSRPRPAVPGYRMTLQFYFTRPIDVELWRCIKSPPGWRKAPVTAAKAREYLGVRFFCTHYKYMLSPEQIEALHAMLLMSLSVNG